MGTLSSLSLEFGLFWRFEDNIRSIKDDFDRIEAVLEDEEKKCNQNKAAELLLKSLWSASLNLENVLDEISIEALLQRLHEEMGIFKYWMGVSGKRFFIYYQLVFCLSFEGFDLRLTPSSFVKDTGVVGVMLDRKTSSLMHDSSSILGRNEEVEMVIEKICHNYVGKYDNSEILVYGIRGMEGVGKITLAKLVYNHQRVNQYLQVKEIIKKIMESLGESNEATQLDTPQSSLQDMLRGKKFLVVLDDVWNEEGEKPKWKK